MTMNQWGSYESVKELAQSGLGFLWSARPTNAVVQGESYIIKTTEGLAILGDPERLDRESALFLESAKAQTKVVDSGASHWVKLHEFGKTDAGAFYVADFYARSVQKIVARGIRLDARSLSTVAHAVVDGLLELRAALARPHGNLKPSNVLIGGPDGPTIDDAPVLLTDPKPDSTVSPRDAEADLHALGRLIYELVMLRPVRDRTTISVSLSDDWSRLGSTALQWVDLCNLLMGGVPGRPMPDLEEVRGLIPSAASVARKTKAGLIGVAAILVLAVGGTATYFATRKPVETAAPRPAALSLPELDQQWSAFVMDWSGWFGGERRTDLAAKLAALPAETRARLPEGLAAALGYNDHLVSPDAASNRSRLSEVRQFTPSRRAEEIPERERKAWADDLSASVRAVSEARSLITTALDPAALTKLKEEWTARGWAPAAARLDAAISVAQRLANASKSESDLPGPGDISDALASAADAARVQEALAKIEPTRAKLAGSGDEILAKYGDVVNREGAKVLASDSSSLSPLIASLNALDRKGVEAASLVAASDRDIVSLRATDTYNELKAVADLDAAKLDRWLATLRDDNFRVLPESELAQIEARRTTLAAKIKTMLADLDRAVEKKRKFPEAPPERTRDTLNTLAGELAKVGFDEAGKPIRVSKQSRPPVDRAYADLEARVAVYDNKNFIPRGLANTRLELLELAKKIRYTSPALNGLWDKLTVEISNDASMDISDQSDLLLDTWKSLLDQVVSPEFLPSALKPAPGLNGVDLVAAIETRRERALEQIAVALNVKERLEGAGVKAARSAYETWRSQAQNKIDSAVAAAAALDQGYLPGDTDAANDPARLAREIIDDAELSNAAIPIKARFAALDAITAQTDTARLITQIESLNATQVAERRAVWRRLASTPFVAADPAAASALLGRLSALASGAPEVIKSSGLSPDRQTTLLGEFAAASPAIWARSARFTLALPDDKAREAAFAAAFAAAGSLGASEATAADIAPAARYNWRVLAAKAAIAKVDASADPATQATAIAAEFAKVEEASQPLAAAPEVASFIKALRTGTTPEAGKTFAASETGPAVSSLAAGMKWTARDDDEVAIYTAGTHTLTFITVTVGDNEALVCTSEVSAALVADVLKAANIKPVAPPTERSTQSLLLVDSSGPDRRIGPRVWASPEGNSIIAAALPGSAADWNGWFASNETLEAPKKSTAFRWIPEGVAIPPPSLDLPMQQVSPEAAALVARRLGCRLPTPEEWAAARASPLADPSANLRDSAWKAVRDPYVAQIDAWNRDARNEFNKIEAQLPSSGIFLPPAQASAFNPATDAEAVGTDGTVFFRASPGASTKFMDLIGNVAEFVTTDPASMDGLPRECSVADAFALFGSNNYAPLRVIGGSALTPPSGPFAHNAMQAQPVDSAARSGYSDVGFRLAITKESGPSGSPLERAQRAFDKKLKLIAVP